MLSKVSVSDEENPLIAIEEPIFIQDNCDVYIPCTAASRYQTLRIERLNMNGTALRVSQLLIFLNQI